MTERYKQLQSTFTENELDIFRLGYKAACSDVAELAATTNIKKAGVINIVKQWILGSN